MKRIIALITALTFALTMAVSAHPFSDVTGHWAEEEIETAFNNKMVNGEPSGTFRPDADISRAEFVKMVTASFCTITENSEVEPVAEGEHWAQNYYNFAAENLYVPLTDAEKVGDTIPGVMDKTNFDAPIERWEMAYILASLTANLFGLPEGMTAYVDYAEVHSSYPKAVAQAIDLCYACGIIRGDENGYVNAGKRATRAEAVTVVNRICYELEVFMISSKLYEEAVKATEGSLIEYDKIPTGHPKATITMENGGKIELELYPEYAPQTVANFVALVEDGFYDGLIFHRVIEGFMAQGGDPNGNGTGGSEKNIRGEFAANGFSQNTLSHQRGVISMARSELPNSASSQFFICYDDASFLDGQYAAFGKVTSGMEVVDSFTEEEMTKNSSGELASPVKPIKIKCITIE